MDITIFFYFQINYYIIKWFNFKFSSNSYIFQKICPKGWKNLFFLDFINIWILLFSPNSIWENSFLLLKTFCELHKALELIWFGIYIDFKGNFFSEYLIKYLHSVTWQNKTFEYLNGILKFFHDIFLHIELFYIDMDKYFKDILNTI